MFSLSGNYNFLDARTQSQMSSSELRAKCPALKENTSTAVLWEKEVAASSRQQRGVFVGISVSTDLLWPKHAA